MRVAVTGSSGYVGTNLIRRLASADWVEAVLGVDVRPSSFDYPASVTHVDHDVRRPLDKLFTDFAPDAVVHLAFVLEPGRDKAAIREVDLTGTANALSATASSGAEYFLYFSSTTVYGPHRDNPEWLTEDSPARPLAGFQYGVDKLSAEQLISEFSEAHPETGVVILRGCPVMGPTADNFVSRAFAKRVLVGMWGYDPPMQLLHETDLIDVLEMSLRRRVTGTYNIAGDGVVHWNEMARMLGRSVITLPAPVLYAMAGATWTLRLQSEAPPAGLAFIKHRWTASTEKIKTELGVRFAHTSSDAWAAYAERLGCLHPRVAPRV